VALTPDKANANLRGRLALPLSDRHADHPALMMANYIFGTSGNSRLWMRIREKDGLSYDVRTSFDWATWTTTRAGTSAPSLRLRTSRVSKRRSRKSWPDR
jgi:predicted Zn-dependent peptidase